LTNDTILVSQGVYYENINFIGKAIVVKADGPAELVIINGSCPVDPNSGSVETFSSGEMESSVLDGFIITGGTGNMTNNGKAGDGIGEYSATGSGGNQIISNCVIYNNSAESYGGGIMLVASTYPSKARVINCTIIENFAAEDGSDVALSSFAGGVQFINCIIWSGSIYSATLQGNYNYCDIQGGWPSGIGYINKDPLFCDVNSYDFHIFSHYPCLGKGKDGMIIGALGIGCDSIVTADSSTSIDSTTRLFNYPLDLGTSWTNKYKYYKPDGSINITGTHYWSVIDSSTQGNLTSFKFMNIKQDTSIYHFIKIRYSLFNRYIFFLC
jgi:hypothetical protein